MARNTEESMMTLMRRYESGKISRDEVCNKQGMKTATFYYWWKRYRDKKDEDRVRFVQLAVGDEQVNEGYDIEVSKGELRIRFSGMVPVDYLAQLLALA